MAAVRMIEHPFSALLRDPKRVVEDLQRGDVLLRRRGAPPLRLSSADRDQARAAAFDALARLLRTLAAQDPAAMREALVEAFPWASFLPDEDLGAFAAELSHTLLAASELDTYSPVSQLLTEWRATAEVHADPELARRLQGPLTTTGERVPAPRR